MTFLLELRAFILTSSAVVTAVVDNVYVGPKPEKDAVVRDWVQLQQVGGSDLEDLSGLEGTTKARVQITCCTTQDPGNALALRDVIRAFLGNYRGAMGAVAVTGINDAGAEFDYPAPEISAYCCSRDYYIWYVR